MNGDKSKNIKTGYTSIDGGVLLLLGRGSCLSYLSPIASSIFTIIWDQCELSIWVGRSLIRRGYIIAHQTAMWWDDNSYIVITITLISTSFSDRCDVLEFRNGIIIHDFLQWAILSGSDDSQHPAIWYC